MADRGKVRAIVVWKGCDPAVAEAIRLFQEEWRPYSTASRRYPIVRLIQKIIDPALAEYASDLPERYLRYIPGGGRDGRFGGIIRKTKLPNMLRVQRQLLRTFVRKEDRQSCGDRKFIATMETLIELVWNCKLKLPLESPLRDSLNTTRELNSRRPQQFCRFCGNPAELASYADDESQWRGKRENDKLYLSAIYCSDHRPKLQSGKWNPVYQRAMRSASQFELELARLTRQCAHRNTPQTRSGRKLVDEYFFHHVLGQTLRPGDEAELRHQARLMVDARVTDRKKEMLALQRHGCNQTEIAKQLGIERQAVSKALSPRSIPEIFRLGRPQKKPTRRY